MTVLFVHVVAVLLYTFSYCASSACLGEFQQCQSGECANSPNDCSKYCGSSANNKYVCPISKRCINSVSEYNTCPGIKGTHLDSSLTLNQRLDFLIRNLTLNEKYPQLTNGAPEILRLGIPAYNWLNDDVHSVRNNHATVFPDGCGLGATFSKEDLFITGNTIGYEARGLHADLVHSGNRGSFNGAGLTAYGPNMNLVRDPRWGRSQEVYSEDPRLAAHLTHHFVQGYQFGGGQNDKYILLAACCKHFAAYDLETIPANRVVFNAIIDAVSWAETYAPVFRECVVRSQVQHIMCSYNSINGIPTCGDKNILDTVLRQQWGFEGFVVSDYDAMANILNTHHYTSTMAEAVALAIKAGCDQEGGGTGAIHQIPAAIQQGLMTEDDVNTAFRRLYRTKFMLGFFDPPLDVAYNNITSADVESDKHLNLSRQVAADSICLYKNRNNALPLDPNTVKGIAVIGPQAINPGILAGNYANYPDKGCKTILEGLRSGLRENVIANCTVLENVDFYQNGSPGTGASSVEECCSLCLEQTDCNYWTLYQNTCYFKETADGKVHSDGRTSGQCLNKNRNSKVENANGCNNVGCDDISGFQQALALITNMRTGNGLSAIIVMLGLDGGQENEGHDRTIIELPGHQNDLVAAVYNHNAAAAVPVPLICVLLHGGAVALGNAADQCDAVVDAWYPGQMGGYAIADVILGYKSPAGRAAVTFYQSTADLAPPGEMNEYAGKGMTYRFFTGQVLYPFGFGLSYTTFSYSNLRTNATNNALDGCAVIGVTVSVENTGNVRGDEVVQLYVDQSGSASVPVPRIRLADFERVKDLAPGATRDVNLILTPRYHSAVYNKTSPTYFQPDVNIEKGDFLIYAGGGQPKYFQGAVSQRLTVSTAQSLSKCANQD